MKSLPVEIKHKLFSIWMSKQRLDGSKTIDLMFAIDDEWKATYKKHRKDGFQAAQLKANERILSIVYGPDYIQSNQ